MSPGLPEGLGEACGCRAGTAGAGVGSQVTGRLPPRTLYIQGERRLDFTGWLGAIQKAAASSGDTLSEQQLGDSDIPVIVYRCVDYITQCGEPRPLARPRPAPPRDPLASPSQELRASRGPPLTNALSPSLLAPPPARLSPAPLQA